MIELFEQKNGSVSLVEKEEGEALQTYVKKKGKLDVEEFLKLAIEMSKCLQCAHSKQILH
eukprot:gene12260-5844_t